jgi:hypothetical protein
MLPSLQRRAGWVAALSLVSALAALRAAERTWPEMTRPFWQDECKHNYAILDASSLTDMLARIGYMSQPALDHALKRVVWFPLLGHQERGLRLPSFAYYLALLMSVVWLTAGILRRRGHPPAYALFGALLAGLWLTTKPDEPWYGCEARHYALVSLLSCWWFHLTMVADRPSRAGRWLVSLAFANTHFFALPLIAAASLLDAVSAWRGRNRLGGMIVLGGALAIAVVTIAVNHAAWRELTSRPPGGAVPWLAGLLDGGRVWWSYTRYVRLPVTAVAVWAGLLLVAKRRDAGRLLLFVLVFLPLFLISLRLRSDYPFSSRYLTPFFGGAFVTLLLAFDRGRVLLAGLTKRFRLSPKAGRAAGWAAVAALVVLFKVGPAVHDLVRLRGALGMIPENGSPTFHMYEAIKRADVPVLVISENCWNDLTHRLYFRFIGTPFGREVRLLRQSTCAGGASDVRVEAARCLADCPRGLVVLDQTDTGDHACGGLPASPPGGGLRVEQAPDGECAWFVRGARTASDIRRAARAVGFRSLRWWYAP